MRLATSLDRFALLKMVGSPGSSWHFDLLRTSPSISRPGSRALPHEPPPFAEAVHLAILTHCNQYASGFRRGALHGRPRRVERRVARESADLRGARHVSRTAASSAADPTESYAPGKSHEISRCTP